MPHIGPVSVPEGRHSSALWSTNPTGTAIVFVHGFGGSSVGTWSEFEMRLPAEPNAEGADLLFYGYDGIRTRAQTSAIRLRDTLDAWMRDPTKFVNGTLPPARHRAASPVYTKLIVVAHSLGAVVARRALLDAYQADLGWLANVHLVLFAPAHRGAAVIDLARGSLSGVNFLLATVGLVQHFSVLGDLDPEKPFLQTLMAHHKEAIQDPRGKNLAAKAIAVAPSDYVVVGVDFLLADAPPVEIPNSTHTTVCKPSYSRLEPLDVLRRFL